MMVFAAVTLSFAVIAVIFWWLAHLEEKRIN